MLLSAGADTEKKNWAEITALQLAQCNEHMAAFTLLLAAGANADSGAGDHTPLMVAAQKGQADTIRELLKHGCNVDMRDKKGNTALM
jgi:ankyrin repeat protein